MRSRALASLVLLLPLALAGCVDPATTLRAQGAGLGLELLPQAASLWPDRQNEPHPAFGWPTLTHPAEGDDVPVWWRPIPSAELPARVSGVAHVTGSPDLKIGAGIALFGSLAIVPPGFGKTPTSVLDISDPTAPKVLGELEPVSGAGRGAGVIAYPDGRLVTVLSTDKGFDVYDITDPTEPAFLASVSPKTGGHKLGVVPGTPIVYNANSRGGGPFTSAYDPKTATGQTEIYDLTDPARPVLVQEWKNGYGCHHIYFWNDASQHKHRALCAGIEMTQIWDVADPRAPTVVSNVPVPHGDPSKPSVPDALVFSHMAMLNERGDVLIVGDEFQGGGPAECDGVRTPARDVSGPFGNLWFYDVKDEKAPKLLGWISPPPARATDPTPPRVDPGGSAFSLLFATVGGCTAHHGRLVPDPEGKRDLLVMAWYRAGVVLIDFTDPKAPDIVDQWQAGGNVWEAWYYNGYVFTGDLARGFDVLRLE